MSAPSVALVVIATGARYHRYVRQLLASAERFFIPHEALLFTDGAEDFGAGRQVKWFDHGYPRATLLRYHAILTQERWLARFDYIFYVDVDMTFVAPIAADEIFSEGITATTHCGYVGMEGTPEQRRGLSTAYLAHPRVYFAGGFVGGTCAAFLRMAEVIARNVDRDDANGVTALWHDESHLNRYLYDNPPARILTPAFCAPGHIPGFYENIWRRAGYAELYTPKIQVIDKGAR